MRTTNSNLISVVVRQLGASDITVTVEDWATVADILSEAGLSTAKEVRYNGQVVALNDEPENGDVLVVTTATITQG